MTDDPLLYQPSDIRGSYFNRMLDCRDHNRWVECALRYLPRDLFDEHKENLAFISMAHRDGCRVARAICETREVIILSEHILPKAHIKDVADVDVRYFIFVVLHEVAHAIKKHRSPLYDSLTDQEVKAQECEADDLAFQWFNDYVAELANPQLPAITCEEIELAKTKAKRRAAAMQQLADGA